MLLLTQQESSSGVSPSFISSLFYYHFHLKGSFLFTYMGWRIVFHGVFLPLYCMCAVGYGDYISFWLYGCEIKFSPSSYNAIAFRADFLNLQLWRQTNVQLVWRDVWSSAALGSIITQSEPIETVTEGEQDTMYLDSLWAVISLSVCRSLGLNRVNRNVYYR